MAVVDTLWCHNRRVRLTLVKIQIKARAPLEFLADLLRTAPKTQEREKDSQTKRVKIWISWQLPHRLMVPTWHLRRLTMTTLRWWKPGSKEACPRKRVVLKQKSVTTTKLVMLMQLWSQQLILQASRVPRVARNWTRRTLVSASKGGDCRVNRTRSSWLNSTDQLPRKGRKSNCWKRGWRKFKMSNSSASSLDL